MPPTPLWLMPRENEKLQLSLFGCFCLSSACRKVTGSGPEEGGMPAIFFVGMSEASFSECFHGGVSFLNKLNSFFHWLPKNCKIPVAIGGNAGQFFFYVWSTFFNGFDGVWDRPGGSLEALWEPFGGSFGGLERALRPTWRHLGPTWRQLGATCRILLIFWGQLGANLGPILANWR